MTRSQAPGELALVLHTHMPYVEGYGTWPFGEEWLWEAIATCYLPLLEVLRRDPPVTVSLTPVLCDQLDAPGVPERFLVFLRDVRAKTHALDIEGCRQGDAGDLVPELENSAADYRWAEERFLDLGGDLVGALAVDGTWTSAATHAVLPLLASDEGARLQLRTGIESHRARFGGWDGGLWLPECAYSAWVGPLLAEAGVRVTCLDLTDVHGLGSPEALRPMVTPDGVVVVPIDRVTMELVWSDDGYPAHRHYRDYHHHTVHHHRPWANDGALYERRLATALAGRHASHFVSQVLARLSDARERTGRPGLCVCALDTELLGHWWFEGPQWLAAVLDEATRQGLVLSTLPDALTRHEPVEAPAELPTTTWGTPRTLATWDGLPVRDLAWGARAAELRTLAVGPRAGARALRELLALQSSDWAFMVTRRLAGDYPRQRVDGHTRGLDDALRSLGSAPPALRNLAPALDATALTGL